ncbi:MAG: hypothetical protein ACREEM_53875, partial [Blastocatellia bacterium]
MKLFQRTVLLTIALLFFVGLLMNSSRPDFGIATAGGEKPGADEWFYEQRAYPLNEIPHGARLRAIEQMERVEARRASLFSRTVEAAVESQPRWEALGPRPIANGNTAGGRPVSGRASAVALDPGYDGVSNRTVYLGAAQG